MLQLGIICPWYRKRHSYVHEDLRSVIEQLNEHSLLINVPSLFGDQCRYFVHWHTNTRLPPMLHSPQTTLKPPNTLLAATKPSPEMKPAYVASFADIKIHMHLDRCLWCTWLSQVHKANGVPLNLKPSKNTSYWPLTWQSIISLSDSLAACSNQYSPQFL